MGFGLLGALLLVFYLLEAQFCVLRQGVPDLMNATDLYILVFCFVRTGKGGGIFRLGTCICGGHFTLLRELYCPATVLERRCRAPCGQGVGEPRDEGLS